jgi:Ca2+-transporting ATPase
MHSFPHTPGLSEEEANARLSRFGLNVLSESRSRSVLDIARNTIREPMFLLLLGAAALYLFVGDLAEGLFLSAGAFLSFSLVVIQEARSERALKALNALAEPRARVVRDGEVRTIAAAKLVPGDLILVGEGGRIPADAQLLDGDALEVDESTLTGESSPSTKRPQRLNGNEATLSTPGEELSASLFAATLIVRGQGLAMVVRTGRETEVGRIGIELAGSTEDPTLLQSDLRRLIGRLGMLAVAFCAVVAVTYGIFRNDWFGGALAGLTLAISLIPEEFPMVLTIFMALGALRLARHNVLVRRSAVIETLGATTLLCVDKTGTLTENKMALMCVWCGGHSHELAAGVPADAKVAVEAAQLASAVRPHDPMDTAVHAASAIIPHGGPLRSYPLRPDFLAFVQVWPSHEKNGVIYAAKGAHEAILPLCGMDRGATEEVEAAAHKLGERGMRVLAVATAEFESDPNLEPFQVEYRFKGLLGFEDPVRSDVPGALEEASLAGVGVAMITGDFPSTALAAAKMAGISTTGGVTTGADIAKGTAVPHDTRIFARIMPEQKVQLVREFKDAGHIVAMTGDGVNDGPALAAADIGIAMGQRGTDVAREASDLILLDDRFASIIGGIRLGRRIFANLRRAMVYIAAVHIPIAGLALLPILLGLPPMLFPMHLVLLELLLDPLCSLVFEGEPSAADAMRKPPRRSDEPLFGARQISLAVVLGSVLLASVFGFYAWMNQSGVAEEVARAAAFIALVVGHLSLAIAESKSTGSRLFGRERIAFWCIVGGAIAVLAAATSLPFMLEILRFSPPPLSLLSASVAVGMLAGGWYGIFLRLTLRRASVTAAQGAIAA